MVKGLYSNKGRIGWGIDVWRVYGSSGIRKKKSNGGIESAIGG